MKTPQVVEETLYGIYLWQMPNGAVVTDEERNYLSIAARKGDPVRIERLRQAARSLGIDVGQPLWLPGHRKVTEEEYETQKQRLNEGLIPDDYDAPAWAEEIKRNGRD